MSHFDLIRQQARAFRREICGEDAELLLSAETLLQSAENFTLVRRLGLYKNDPILCGALALLDEDRIYFDKTLPQNFAFYCQAHEFAHLRLHELSAHCTGGEINFSVAETEAFDAESRVLGYGQSERIEREANAFAAEFLLPGWLARKAFFDEKLNASAIARKIGLPVNLIYSQLAQSLIENHNQNASPISEFKFQNKKQEISGREQMFEDRTQIDASRTDIYPTLLEAAPGTGKTRTLIERICFLIKEKEVLPESILALTFSNKAAEEMRERIAGAIDKETATKIYITTFHAFGLNLLRKYHTAARLPGNAPVIDRITAVELLEERLLSLKLKHFQNLREPLENLPRILTAISRAKDELVSAREFRRLAEAQMEKAETPDEIEKAEKCLETAHVYQIYDEFLHRQNLLDYGDLIFRAVSLLRANEAICESIGAEFQHVLVDEYQDVNRASAELVRLVSCRKNIWAVGDARQAIYRWRGAATTRNVRDFAEDFPAPQNLYLGKNYRSRPRIVAAVSTFAKDLDCDSANKAAANFTNWQAHRSDEEGEIRFAVTENLAEEAAWMAEQMRKCRDKGINWRGQAVIARTHLILQRVAEELEKQNVPFLYIGNWLESEVARDLLSWLALIGETDKYALVRVKDFPAYKISFVDVQSVVSYAVENKTSIAETINALLKTESLDETSRKNFERLLGDISSMPEDSSIWNLLANYLFENAAYLINSEKDSADSARLALYQLLQMAQSFDAKNAAKNLSRESAIQEFLRYIRRLKMFGEEQALQQIPVSMQETDAVRLLTIHAAKGLEFEAVYVPHLGARFYPKSRRGNSCPLPDGVTDLDEKAEHEKEEKCLFFVAISRAKNVLCLSRSARYGNQTSNTSPFLKTLAEHLPFSPESGASWHSPNFQPETEEKIELLLAGENLQNPEFFLNDLENYDACPRRYFYQTRLKKDKSSGAIFLEFYRSLHKALNFCLEAAAAKREFSFDQLTEIFQNRWKESIYSEHVYAELYTAEAAEILQNAFSRVSAGSKEHPSDLKRCLWHYDLPNGRVLFSPDFFLEFENKDGRKQILAESWRNGKLRKKEAEETLYQLLHESIGQKSGTETEVKVLSLKTGEEIFVPRKLRRNKEIPPEEKFASLIKAADGIARRRFMPKPNENCPSCQFYFICPSGD